MSNEVAAFQRDLAELFAEITVSGNTAAGADAVMISAGEELGRIAMDAARSRCATVVAGIPRPTARSQGADSGNTCAYSGPTAPASSNG
jgi:hypothetical protein